MKLLVDILIKEYGVGPARAPICAISWARTKVEERYGWRTADTEVEALNKWRLKRGYTKCN